MKQYFILLTIVLISWSSIFSQNYNWEWSQGYGSEGPDWIKDLKIDNRGNSYVLVEFGGDQFDCDSERMNNFHSQIKKKGYFLGKFSPTGKLIWKKNLNSQSNSTFHYLDTDFEGNCYITGVFAEQYAYIDHLKFNNSSGLDKTNDAFLAKVSTDGKTQWIKLLGALGNDIITHLEVDGSGNSNIIYLGAIGKHDEIEAGTFKEKGLKFSTRYVSEYVIRYNSDGKRLWVNELIARQMNTTSFSDLAADEIGNLYIAGNYDGDFAYIEDIKIRTNNTAFPSKFLMKLNSDGEVEWADNGYGDFIEVDEIGNLFILGSFKKGYTEFLDIYHETLETQEGEDLYIVKFDSDGGYLWYKTFGALEGTTEWSNGSSGGYSTPYKFRYGQDGNLYLLGHYFGESIFGKHTVYKEGLHLIRMDEDGNFLKPITWIKDDLIENPENPLQNYQGASALLYDRSLNINDGVFNLTDMEVDPDGNLLFAGHQYSAELLLAKRKLVNSFAHERKATIWTGKLIPKE